ncbi:hypothetical protein HPB49_002262 [Dermacentor silvarum]|uniref:Uncharacterized protein n=1 Tax=Dermacentor silvarum TaxID=543639 RepID=A0ACB8DI61_DERSI|nr:hypothetical protein HPB49_002262 [Dermacentor silvarum]
MCIFLECDPAGRPYERQSFEKALEELGLDHDVACIGKLRRTWLIKLKTTETLQTLVKAGGMMVRGHYCAIVDPAMEETWMTIHWVPLNISSASLREALQEFGLVKKVTCRKWSMDEDKVDTTSRHVRICLKEGLEVTDLPHLWEHFGVTMLIVTPRRPPFCLVCLTPGHLCFQCTVPRRDRREQVYDPDTCSCSCCHVNLKTSDPQVNENVSAKSGGAQVTPTAERGDASGFRTKKRRAGGKQKSVPESKTETLTFPAITTQQCIEGMLRPDECFAVTGGPQWCSLQ